MSTAAAILPVARRPARWSLILALLGLPGCTVAWDLPAGGYWIGMPLAFAAVVIGARCLRVPDRQSRRVAVAAVILAVVEILFTATWTVVG
jgi:phosphatidylserine synthase